MVHPLVRKFGPTAAVFTLTAWCGWQHLEDASPLADFQDDGRTKIDVSAFSPELPLRISRNMFSVGGQAAKKLQLAAIAAAAPPPFDPTDMLASLQLKGTFIHGDRRFAVVNGLVFNEGDQVAVDEASGVRCQLVQVEKNAAVLRVDGKRYRLVYGGNVHKLASRSKPLTSFPSLRIPKRKGAGFSLMRALSKSIGGAAPQTDALSPQLESLRNAVPAKRRWPEGSR